jgi:hypothetical protein
MGCIPKQPVVKVARLEREAELAEALRRSEVKGGPRAAERSAPLAPDKRTTAPRPDGR